MGCMLSVPWRSGLIVLETVRRDRKALAVPATLRSQLAAVCRLEAPPDSASIDKEIAICDIRHCCPSVTIHIRARVDS